jgi:hypothetical protein
VEEDVLSSGNGIDAVFSGDLDKLWFDALVCFCVDGVEGLLGSCALSLIERPFM